MPSSPGNKGTGSQGTPASREVVIMVQQHDAQMVRKGSIVEALPATPQNITHVPTVPAPATPVQNVTPATPAPTAPAE